MAYEKLPEKEAERALRTIDREKGWVVLYGKFIEQLGEAAAKQDISQADAAVKKAARIERRVHKFKELMMDALDSFENIFKDYTKFPGYPTGFDYISSLEKIKEGIDLYEKKYDLFAFCVLPFICIFSGTGFNGAKNFAGRQIVSCGEYFWCFKTFAGGQSSHAGQYTSIRVSRTNSGSEKRLGKGQRVLQGCIAN